MTASMKSALAAVVRSNQAALQLFAQPPGMIAAGIPLI
jgi:hypothetical protein